MSNYRHVELLSVCTRNDIVYQVFPNVLKIIFSHGTSKTILSHGSRIARVGLLLVLWVICHVPQSAFALDGAAVMAAVDRHMHPVPQDWHLRIEHMRPRNQNETVVLYGLSDKKPRRAAVVVAPDDRKGWAILRDGDQIKLHLPGEETPRPTTLKESVVGGLFTNADLLAYDLQQEYQLAGFQDASGADYVLELRPKDPNHPYRKVRLEVDRRFLVPKKMDQYITDTVLLKTITFRELRRFGDTPPRPVLWETQSPLNAKYRAVLRFGEIRPREVRDWMFSQEFLPRFGLLLQ
jgi:hypothetical protein